MADISETVGVLRYFCRQESVLKLEVVDKCFSELCEVAKNSGMTDENLSLCSVFITKHCKTSKMFSTVLKCMLPVSTVPDQVVIAVLVWIKLHFRKGFGQAVVCGLQWIAGLLEFDLASDKCIDNFYNLFLVLLERKETEVISCWLVSRLSKSSDVNRNLVLQLLRLRAKSKSNIFDTVLWCFKTVKPECVPEPVTTRNVILNSKVSQYFKEHFRKAQERKIASGLSTFERKIDRMWKISDGVKRRRIDAIPGIEFLSLGSNLYRKKEKNLLEINDWNQFVKHFWDISLPCNLVSLLQNDFGRTILIFRGPSIQERFSHALYATLQSVIIDRSVNVSMSEQINLLNKICEMQESMQQGIPVMSRFLATYIPFWDGFTHLHPILALLPWVTFSSYDELYHLYLMHIYYLFISVNDTVKCGILKTLLKLVENLAKETISVNEHLFLNSPKTEPINDILKNLIEYVNNICTLGLHFEPHSSSLLCHVLYFYEHLAVLEEKRNLPIRSVLPPVAMYYCLFSRNPINLERVCGLLVKYNSYCGTQNRHLTVVLHNPNKFIEALIYDFLSILWLKEGLQRRKYGFIFKCLSSSEISSLPENLDVYLSLSKYPPLLCFYKHFNGNDSLRKVLRKVLPTVYQFLKLATKKASSQDQS